ncbi:MAG: hypothetical protein AB8B87_03340 [Granulosicoccus sp.]
MEMKQLATQILSTATLYAEILICIAAASLLGWIVGLMMRSSRHKKRLHENTEKWEDRYRALEDSARDDAENLEEQLQTLASETKSLQATNRALTDTLKKNDTNIQKARAEAIELNRQHAESHERLQRIIQQKDREIAELGNRLNLNSDTKSNHGSYRNTASTTPSEKHSELLDSDLNYADTVAISPMQTAAEVMDATVQMSVDALPAGSTKEAANISTSDLDASLDDTSDLSEMGLEESTIAMDDEALAFAQRSYKGHSRD